MFTQEIFPLYLCVLVICASFLRFRLFHLYCFLSAIFAGWLIYILGPPLSEWEPIGHSTQYIPYFMGDAIPSGGDTLRYPAMQLWWWGIGKLFPQSTQWMLVVSLLMGGLAVMAFGLFIHRLVGLKPALVAVAFMITQPIVIQWSHSIYNVIFPFAFFALACAVLVKPKADKWDHFLASALLVIACSMRLEMAIAPILLAIALFFSKRKPSVWAPALGFGVSVTLIACFPLLDVVPGEGERLSSFFNHVGMTFFWSPYDGILGMALISVAAGLAFRFEKMLVVFLVFSLLCIHLLMSSFDDYGTRHSFLIFFCFGSLVAIASKSRIGLIVLSGVALLNGLGLSDLHKRFYATPEDMFTFMAQSEFHMLESKAYNEARLEGCAWISEEHPFEATPTRSHFNLLNSVEMHALKEEYGCIDWCWGLEDWRINSLSVRDRWMKLQNLYTFTSLDQVVQGDMRCYRQRLTGSQPLLNLVWISRSW